jgi:hypothetical protein
MRTSRYTETKIIVVLKRRNGGAKAAEVYRECGMSEATSATGGRSMAALR